MAKQRPNRQGKGIAATTDPSPAATTAAPPGKRPREKRAVAPGAPPRSVLGPRAIAVALAAAAIAVLCACLAKPGLLLALLRRSAAAWGSPSADALLFEPMTVRGGQTFGPSFGLYPRGCRWRDVTPNNISQQVHYQYWNHTVRTWSERRPAACSLQGDPKPGPAGWGFLNGTPRTEVRPFKTHVIYQNLWYSDGRWYALVDGPNHVPSWRFSRNQEILTLHVADAKAFAASVDWRVQRGDTLLFDYIFFTHPTAIGHWWEMVAPLFSVLKRITFKRPCDSFVLLHLRRSHLPEWVRAMLAVALGVGPRNSLPPIYLQEPTDSIYAQTGMPLEGVPAGMWVVFERVLIIRDVFTGGSRTFASREDAHEFRAAVYAHYGLPRPARREAVPRTITFQRKRANRRVLNEDDLLHLLRSYGEVRVVEFNGTSSLQEQLLTMRGTGLFVSVHTSNLANAPMLQPGSAVLEFIPRHWSWMDIDRSFKEQTAIMGDIHHWAWRANRPNESIHIDQRDAIKFAHWTKEDCQGSEECIESQTKTDMRLDLRAIKKLLDGRMPLVWAGRGVKAAELPWPPEAP